MNKEPILEYVDFHKTRPGHDRRYGLDGAKLTSLGWKPVIPFKTATTNTIQDIS